MDFIIGGMAAGGAGFFSNPLDVLKTRLQLQGELRARGEHAVHYRNVFQAAAVVIKNDGILGLQKGVAPAVVMHFIRNSVRLGTYQWASDNGLLTDKQGHTIFYRSFIVSSFGGAAGAFLGSPLFLIKTQIQAQANQSIAVGHQHGHTGPLAAIKQIHHEYGIRGLWRGCAGTMLRAIAGSSSQLTAFAMTKDFLKNNKALDNYSPIVTSLCASFVGGIFQVICITPFDLISTRLYNQPVDAQGKGMIYKNIPDCFSKIWRTEGVFAFYKGVTANYLRLGPHGALTLVFWDMLKDVHNKYKSKSVSYM